jgi:hypothetical protein
VFGHRDRGQEGVGEHGQRGPAVPGFPGADLVLVQAEQALASLEGFLDRPAAPRDGDQGLERDGRGGGTPTTELLVTVIDHAASFGDNVD